MKASVTKTTLKSIKFSNFKGLREFELQLNHMNILVGQNNSGKSTILSAFRILAAGIKVATKRKPEIVEVAGKRRFAYRINPHDLPFSFENVHTDLSESDTNINFLLTNATSLRLHFPIGGGCFLYCEQNGVIPESPTEFKRACPIVINHVPVLGPVDYYEQSLTEETVHRGLNTHRASSHFRNYWYYQKGDFAKFASLLKQTWPGMTIAPPEIHRSDKVYLMMFCTENKLDREIFWAGFGFQVWCQLLTHLCRSDIADLLIVDEPEIYLHPDLQRQLIGILRELGPDIVVATHSSP